jgi:hypothetical protein
MQIVALPVWNVRFTVTPNEGYFWWFNVSVAARNSAEAKTIALENGPVGRMYGNKVFSEVESVTQTPQLVLIDVDSISED